ncbi:cytochrome c class I [Hymenobacter roseosalivarius DSM 11622]|uniref:Cytochrome c class I n=1 Tax=Hymenobacter roseosalivarius DSM 11622 TaxID=645990 RepID=A0A1W1V468_9BACT|nr:cytochrome c [Hymenobacter roseosalivarius]SMB88053.1 cytochrome c class I [Hymenobacter roseosalivarius DSM 11622]
MKQILFVVYALAWFSQLAAAQQKTPPKVKPTTKTAAKLVAVSAATLTAGKAVYTQNCLTCHMADGGGVERMNPPLNGTTWVLGDKTRLVKVVLNGLEGEDIDGESYASVMPAFDALTDKQIADVLTYVRNSFGNKATAVAPAEVKAIRAANKK